MDRLGNDILTRSCFTRNQTASVCPSNSSQPINNALHAVAGKDQVLKTKSLVKPCVPKRVLDLQPHRLSRH